MEQKVIQTNKGHCLIRIGYDKKSGDNVFYSYTHSNGNQYWNRIIPAKFVRYTKDKEVVIIQRDDNRKKSKTRTSILKVFMDIKLLKINKEVKQEAMQSQARHSSQA